MKKSIVLLLCAFFMMSAIFVSAQTSTSHDEAVFDRAKEIINAETPCEQLTDADLEALGDYFMELMHPGDAHEAMDDMMGGEGSASLERMHISLGRSVYCEEGRGGYGMMGGSYAGGMMGSNRIAYPTNGGQNNMMGYYGYGMGGGLLWFVYLALAAFIFGIIFWWTKSLFDRRRPAREQAPKKR